VGGTLSPEGEARMARDDASARSAVVGTVGTTLRDRERVRLPTDTRLAYLDNLKTLLIAGIIASHALMGYATFGSWTYQDFQEVTLSDTVEKVYALLFVLLGGLFLMALFFLVSGLLTEDSLARKGSARFVEDRLLRLGIPFAVYTLIVWPLLEFSLFGPLRHRGFWDSFTDTDPILDNGPMWFVGVLLLFSVTLAAWRTVFPPPTPSDAPLRWRHLVVLALVVGVATFGLRIVLPVDSNQPLNLHLWGWPEYIAMFGLGITAARRGWLRPVPRALATRCGIAAVAATLAIAFVAVSTDLRGLEQEAYLGGWRRLALAWAMAEGVLAVAGPIWVLAFVQRHLNGTGRLRRAMARSSYMAFMLQGPVLVALAVMLRPIDLTGDVKALLVAMLGIVGSFGLAWPLVTKTAVGRAV
jgi:fucose 4-O-acetylase-like acetyltransferase